MSEPGFVAPPPHRGHPAPLVSVVLPVYNYETYLEETVDSVLAQTHDRWELLLVDDGSSDASPKIARRYAERYPEQVRYLEHPGGGNRGCPASRNLGIRHARGEYLAFLDADDVWLPAKLATQVALLRAHPGAAMTYGPSQWWYSWTGAPDDAGRDCTQDLGIPPGTLTLPPALLAHFLRNGKTVPPPSAVLATREAVERAGGFEERLRGPIAVYEDQAFYAKVALAELTLYERIRGGDPTEVAYFREARRHSRAGVVPVVRHKLTPGVYQVVDGHHRLAIAWFLGRRRARVTVLPPMPTELQLLVLAAEDNGGRRQLRQPIDRPEFDHSWPVEVACQERLAAMFGYLEGRTSVDHRLAVLDLGCSYGWFVSRFAAAGCRALGVDAGPAVLKIARLAFGLRVEHLAQSAPPEFVARCERAFDVVLVSGGLRARGAEGDTRDLTTFLERVDSITGSCLFVDAARLEELRSPGAARRPDPAALVSLIKASTSFRDVTVLGDEPGALIACSRPRP
jgi:glycosyltransferase involved in cell wall biosynthesis/SAM-dependent methyltransferase